MSSINKFQKNRSVSEGYFMIPLCYTGLINPKNKNKELVLMESLGNGTYSACWRNSQTNKVGIYFLIKMVKGKMLFKGKTLRLSRKYGWVW